MNGRLFTIQDSDYFRTGHLVDGTQVLIARWGDEAIRLRFAPEGQLLGVDPIWVGPYAMGRPGEGLDSFLSNQGVNPGPIRISAFELPEWGFGLREMPSYLSEYVDAPTSFPSEEREHLARAVDSWRQRRGFALLWGEDYEMTEQGEVEST